MHMSDALLSPAVGGAMYAVSAVSIAYAVQKIKKDDLGEKNLPMMAVAGAFTFAAQMINFTIPGTGSSGHIGGGILLAGLLGGTAWRNSGCSDADRSFTDPVPVLCRWRTSGTRSEYF